MVVATATHQTQTTTPTPDTLDQIARDPEQFAAAFMYILDKKRRRRKLVYNQTQRHYLKNRTPRDLILKARQLGFSTMIQAEWFRMATTRAVGTMTLAHIAEATQRMRRMADFFYDELPVEDHQKPKRKYANASVTTYPLLNSEAAIGTAGSLSVGRSFTLTHLHGSEVAFWPDAEKLIAGAMQAGDPAIALESTPNGAQGPFYELCMEALDGNSDWKLHFYPWWWDAGYQIPLEDGETLDYTEDEAALAVANNLTPEQIKWRRSKQRELKRMFLQEYPEDERSCFLLSGVGFFGALEGVFTAPLNPTWHEGRVCYAGLDWGQMNDYTVLSIGDQTTSQQVSLLRMRGMEWGAMRARIAEECRKWHCRWVIAEENSASSNIEELKKLLPSVHSFTTTNKTKSRGMNGMYESLYTDGWKLLPDPNQEREMRALQTKQTASGTWTYAAPGNEHDDIVIANMLMLHAVNRPTMKGARVG